MSADTTTRRSIDLVLFVCRRNAGASQMAAAFFNRHVDRQRVVAISAGVDPARALVQEVVDAMAEVGLDLSKARPRKLTPEMSRGAVLVVTLGSGDGKALEFHCARRVNWVFPAPHGTARMFARQLRDEISRRVAALVVAEGWRKRVRRRI